MAGQSREAYDASLDFFSETFDASKALRLGVEPPRPKVRAMATLAECIPLLPPEIDIGGEQQGAEGVEGDSRGNASMGRLRRERERDENSKSMSKAELHRARGERAKRRAAEAVAAFDARLSRFLSAAEAGPLSVLHVALTEKRRVRVITRHAKGIRGTAIGLIQLFDSHINLLMRDVDEEYSVRIKMGRRVVGRRGRVSYRPILEHRRRHLKQVLLRGENVVTVSILPIA